MQLRPLEKKILREYPKYLCSWKLTNKQGIVIYNASISKEMAIRRAEMDDQSIKEAAMYLSSKILSMLSEQKELPRPLTTEAVMKGHDEFVQGCFNDASRFEKPIQRRKVQNFASATVKCKVKTKDLKMVELQGTRNLFGRLLYLSALEHIDLEKVFRFPLTPVPFPVSHLDGSINKTDKSKLLHKLEEKVESNLPQKIDTMIMDAMFFLHTIINPPSSFGKLAEEFLQKICSMAPRIDFVCENYQRH